VSASPPRPDSARPGAPGLARVAAAVLAILGSLPLVIWLGDPRPAGWYANLLDGWVSGTSIVVGGGVVLAIISRQASGLWRDGLLDRASAAITRTEAGAALLLAMPALLIYAAVAQLVFSARPLLIDEIVQLFQARIFASGHLWLPTPAHPEFVSAMHVVDTGAKTYGQFPAGGPAMLALGELLGAPWLVGPVCAATAVAVFFLLLRQIEPTPRVRVLAAGLFAVAPFTAFMAGSQMNHVTALLWILIGVLGLFRSTLEEAPSRWWPLVSGLGFGCAVTIRPLDAAAFAIPATFWYLARAIRPPNRMRDLLLAGAGLAVPVLALFWVNSQTTGSPFRFGYQVLWGNDVGLGFHASPWGAPHTPRLGLELISLYLLRLQKYLFETPMPSLLPVIGALTLTPRLRAGDRYLLWSAALLLGAYFLYWHDGFYLGPRFLYPLAPILSLWAVRFPSRLRQRIGPGLAHRSVVYGSLIAAGVAGFVLIPIRAREYRNGMLTMRWDPDRAAREAGLHDALILVRESWGAQLLARLWALGISRGDAERVYWRVDACALDQAITALEHEPATDPGRARSVLWALTRDSAATVASPVSPDTTERFRPGAAYPPRCVRRVREDRAGFTLMAPLLLAHGEGNVYVRDLHEWNELLLSQFGNRPIYLLDKDPRVGTEPRYHAVDRDSLLRETRGDGPLAGRTPEGQPSP
jgi:hypothetical protein